MATQDYRLSRSTMGRAACGSAGPVPVLLSSPMGLPTKLAVSSPGDTYEQEADRVAERVMRVPAQPQYKPCACGGSCPLCSVGHAAHGREHSMAAACGRVERVVARFARPGAIPDDASAAVARGTSSGGRALDGHTRAFMESRFGRDFSQVRVHTGAAAEQSTRDVNAHAYTVGHDIVFAGGKHSPGTQEGLCLIAHELTHVVQQSSAGEIRNNPNNERSTTSTFRPAAAAAPQVARKPAAAPVYDEACSGGDDDPCQLERCSDDQKKTAVADLARGLTYVNAAVTALGVSPLSGFTTRALDWYFGGHDTATISTVRKRLGCTATSLTSAPGQYGCDPPHNSLAYTCSSGAAFCGHLAENICFTTSHFGQNDRNRAITAIHEASHLEGMSVGSPKTNPDIYQSEMRFLDMSPSQAVQDADSYALFAAVIGTSDQPSTILLTFGAGAGRTFSLHADPSWYYQGSLGLEYQHPRLRVFHPTLSAGFTLLGEAENQETGVHVSPTMLTSVLLGLRIGESRRPGAGGGFEVSLFGGPALAISKDRDTKVGAVAGVAFGYRWHMLDFSIGAGYAYDPQRKEAGLEHTATVGGTFTLDLH